MKSCYFTACYLAIRTVKRQMKSYNTDMSISFYKINDFVNENRRQKFPFCGLIEKLGLQRNVFVKHNRVNYRTLNKSKHYFSNLRLTSRGWCRRKD